MADPTSPTLAALDAVIDYLDHVRERSPSKNQVSLTVWGDGTGILRANDRIFGGYSRPIAEAVDAFEAWLAGTDEASKALDSEIGESVDHLFEGDGR